MYALTQRTKEGRITSMHTIRRLTQSFFLLALLAALARPAAAAESERETIRVAFPT